MGQTAKESKDAGDDFRRGTQSTTWLKSRSMRYNPPARVRVYADHRHHILPQIAGAGVHAELQATAPRFLPPAVVIVEPS